MTKNLRRHILFSGSVQGVGFRYRAYAAAQSLGLSGWVRNLWNGRVEMEVQGREQDILKILSKLQEERFITIEDMEVQDIPIKDEKGFFIR